jgi:hypothetical protein
MWLRLYPSWGHPVHETAGQKYIEELGFAEVWLRDSGLAQIRTSSWVMRLKRRVFVLAFGMLYSTNSGEGDKVRTGVVM